MSDARPIQRYGLEWDAKLSDAAIELQCYARFHGPQWSGKPQEYHLKRAMLLLRPDLLGPNGESWTDNMEHMVWSWCHNSITAVMGHTTAGKTTTAAWIVATDWYASPFDTATSLTTVTLPTLNDRIWADVVRFLQPLDPVADKRARSIQIVDYKHTVKFKGQPDDRMGITGIATAKDKDAVGRIQGLHAPRRRLVIEEAQETSEAVFKAIPNLQADPDFRCFILGNPRERESPFGRRCRPRAEDGGWNAEKYVMGGRYWEVDGSTEKYRYACLRFNALQSENYRAGYRKFPWMIDRDYIEAMRKSPGENSVEWYMYVVASFPPDGLVQKVFPGAVLAKGRERREFVGHAPIPCASLDPGFGGDDAVLTRARYGTLEKDIFGIEVLEQVTLQINRGDLTQPPDWQVAQKAREQCEQWGVAPENLIVDTTGRGAGCHAFMLREWSTAVQSLEYGGKPSEMIVRDGDTRKANEMYRYRVDEIWCAASVWMEEGQLFGNISDELAQQLGERLLLPVANHIRRVEPKDEMKKRLGRSPDHGDSMCQLVELLRRKGAIAGSLKKWKSAPDERLRELEDRYNLDDPEREYSFSAPVEDEEGDYGW